MKLYHNFSSLSKHFFWEDAGKKLDDWMAKSARLIHVYQNRSQAPEHLRHPPIDCI